MKVISMSFLRKNVDEKNYFMDAASVIYEKHVQDLDVEVVKNKKNIILSIFGDYIKEYSFSVDE